MPYIDARGASGKLVSKISFVDACYRRRSERTGTYRELLTTLIWSLRVQKS